MSSTSEFRPARPPGRKLQDTGPTPVRSRLNPKCERSCIVGRESFIGVGGRFTQQSCFEKIPDPAAHPVGSETEADQANPAAVDLWRSLGPFDEPKLVRWQSAAAGQVVGEEDPGLLVVERRCGLKGPALMEIAGIGVRRPDVAREASGCNE
jgi:hypothetical protein